MKLADYFKLKDVKPYKWADEKGFPRATVYFWLRGQKPTISYALKIKAETDNAVGLEDWG